MLQRVCFSGLSFCTSCESSKAQVTTNLKVFNSLLFRLFDKNDHSSNVGYPDLPFRLTYRLHWVWRSLSQNQLKFALRGPVHSKLRLRTCLQFLDQYRSGGSELHSRKLGDTGHSLYPPDHLHNHHNDHHAELVDINIGKQFRNYQR